MNFTKKEWEDFALANYALIKLRCFMQGCREGDGKLFPKGECMYCREVRSNARPDRFLKKNKQLKILERFVVS